MVESKEENPTPEAEKPEEDKPKTLLDEVRAERETLEKVRDEAKAQADRLEKLKSDELLSGTAGGHVPPTPPKEETPEEYRKRVMSGNLNG